MATAQIFDAYVTNVTQDYILPKITDSVLDSNVLTSKLLSTPKGIFRGEQFKVPVRVGISNASAAQGGGFRGTDTFVTTRQDETAQLAFNQKFVYEPYNLILTDLAANMGQEQVIDIVAQQAEYAMSNLMDNIGTMFYSTNSDSSKGFTGLRHIVSATTTYGGLNRSSTYTVLKPGNTSAAGVDTATTALTLAAMRTLSNALDSGAVKTDLIVTTPTIFGLLEDLLTPMQQFNIGGYAQVTRDGLSKDKGSLGAAVGFDALMWNGVPIVRDEKCPSGHMFFLNTKYLGFYNVKGFGSVNNWKQISFRPNIVVGQYDENVGAGHEIGLAWSGFKEPTNQAAVTSQIVLAGELITTNPRRQGGFTALATS